MLRDSMDCYRLFHQYQDEFDASATLEEFCNKAKQIYLLKFVGGWVECAFTTMKAGKETYRGLRLPNANKFSDLFIEAQLLDTAIRNKPVGFHFLSGNAGFAKHLGGRRGYSKTTPGVKSCYGSKFYGTYVKPIEQLQHKNTSFEAIPRTDGILITINDRDHIGCDWVALLDSTEDIRTMFNEETKEFLAKERQAEIDAWGESRI